MKPMKLLRTFLILVIGGVAISGAVDEVSKDYAEQALKRALTTFAIARTLNGVISVAQGTEVAIEPGGVGVIMTPGQLLDPVNDLVERFSSVLLVAASSLGLQLVLLEISSWIWITVLLVAALCIWLAATWSESLKSNKYVALILRLTFIFAFVRFAVPIVIICTNIVFGTFLLEMHDSSAAELQETSVQVEEISARDEEASIRDEEGPESEGRLSDESSATFWDRLRSAYESLPDSEEIGPQIKGSAQEFYADVANWFDEMSVSAKMEQLEESAANATSHIVNLIVIFVLQTIIFPLGFLWIFVEVSKTAATRAVAAIGTTQG